MRTEIEALPGDPTEHDCSLAMMRTAMILHPFDGAFPTLRETFLLFAGDTCFGEMSYATLLIMGAQA